MSNHFFLLLCCSVRDFEQSSIVVMFLKRACRDGKSLFGSERICSMQRHPLWAVCNISENRRESTASWEVALCPEVDLVLHLSSAW